MVTEGRVPHDSLAERGVSQFLTALSDLVNPGERGLAPVQVLLARMDVGLLRERRLLSQLAANPAAVPLQVGLRGYCRQGR